VGITREGARQAVDEKFSLDLKMRIFH
jgi:hypothetical protein